MSVSADADRSPPIPAGAIAPPSGAKILGFFAMVFGMFMAILDIQIVASSLAEIQAGLSASAEEISWVQTSYLIAEVVMIPLSGYLSRLLSTRILFVLSAASFTAMSVVCAFTTSIEGMIVARAFQGFLGGAMIPTVFATAYTIFPKNRQGPASVVVGLIATLAPTIGPTLGGYLTESFSWHWLFLINLVPGLVTALGVWSMDDIDKPNPALAKGFDAVGLISMALFLGCLEYVLEEGTSHDWLSDDVIRWNAAIASIASIIFLYRVLTYHNPIVDLKAFQDRNFAVGSLFSFIIGIGLYGLVYMLPLFLARVRGLSALQIGEVMFVTGLAQFFSAPFAGLLARKFDPRPILVFGFILLASSTYLLSHITADWDFTELMVPQIMRGAALMFCMVPINGIALGTLPPEKLKNASGLYNLMRNLGGAFGLAGINNLLTDATNLHWNRLIEHTSMGLPQMQAWMDQTIARLSDHSSGDVEALAVRQLTRMVSTQATVQAFADCFILLCGLFILALFVLPLLRKPNLQSSGGGH